ncbi:MAG: NUDIX hydrolase [Clostridia bacterium]|nr:NUDIX hydrolase [Clostridia bacterium]
MDFSEKCVKKNYVYQGKILNLRRDDALQPDGRPCVREIVEHSGGACVLYVEKGKVLLVKQYRYAYGEHIYEIPAGKLNAGEDPREAALRELEEETGIRSHRAELLFTLYPSPGYTNEKIYIYQAFEGEQVPVHLDDGEFLEREFVTLERAKEMLKKGEIKDAKTIVALQTYFLNE